MFGPCQFQLEVANANRPAIEVVLAWGGGMNIQYCTTAGFLSYMSKYITKPEPYGTVTDTDSLRARDGQDTESTPAALYKPLVRTCHNA